MKSNRLKSSLMKAHTRPGTVLYTGSTKDTPVKIELISYDKSDCQRKTISAADIAHLDDTKVNWINIIGVHDTAVIEEIGGLFGIDPLVMEDITTIGSRPKYDDYGDYHFVLLTMLSPQKTAALIKHEQLSLIISGSIIITFQEVEGDVFDLVRARITDNKGKIRTAGASYLFYCLLDTIIDQYFYILDAYENRLETLEAEIMGNSQTRHSGSIYSLRRVLLEIRNAIWPARDIINGLLEAEGLFSKTEKKYIHDISDNIRQIMDFITTYRDLVMGLYETYLSNISNRMNRIMTTLTIFSVIFIPLTFLTGVYGMNFEHMPELKTVWGYPVFWILCILISVSMYLFFRRKKWFK